MGNEKYIYRWGNNPKRAEMKGRACRVLCRGAKNSALIEFEDGQREVVSRNALKRLSNQTPGGGVAYRHRERQLPCRQDTVAEVTPTRRAIQATAEIVRPAGGRI